MHIVSSAINRDSIVLFVIIICFLDPQEIATPPNGKMYHIMDFTSKLSVIQFASLYRCTTLGILYNTKNNLKFL